VEEDCLSVAPYHLCTDRWRAAGTEDLYMRSSEVECLTEVKTKQNKTKQTNKKLKKKKKQKETKGLGVSLKSKEDLLSPKEDQTATGHV